MMISIIVFRFAKALGLISSRKSVAVATACFFTGGFLFTIKMNQDGKIENFLPSGCADGTDYKEKASQQLSGCFQMF